MQLFADWLDNFEPLLSDLIISWDGMLLLAGDFNVDLLRPNKAATVKYMHILTTLNLTQLVNTATCTTLLSAMLMDHIITNMPKRVTHCGVLPCPLTMMLLTCASMFVSLVLCPGTSSVDVDVILMTLFLKMYVCMAFQLTHTFFFF